MRQGDRIGFAASGLLRSLSAGLLAAGLLAAAASVAGAAGPFSRLQVLLPGESAAPGTPTGKSGTPQAQTAGVPFTITVRGCDSQWNLVTTATDLIGLLSSDNTATLPPAAALASGSRTFTVTLNSGGSFTIYAHDQTDGTIPDGTSSLVQVQVLQSFTFSNISQKNQNAGQPLTMTVRAVDASGQTVTGYSGSASLKEVTSYGDGFCSPSTVTFSAGVWTGPVTMYRADETSTNRGNVNLYVWLPSAPGVNGTSDPFTVHPGPFARLQLVQPGQTPLPGSPSGLVGSPSSQTSGTAFSVGVYSTDQWWNPVPASDVVRITSSDGAATLPPNAALVNGYRAFNVTLATVGSRTVTASDQTNGAITNMTGAPITVLPASADHFTITNIPPSQTAGVPVAVTIRAVDAAGNPLPTYAGDALLIANTGPGSISPATITLAGGSWNGSITFKGAGGSVSFTVTDYAATPHTGTSNSFSVQAGPLAGLQVLLPGESPQGGTPTGQSGTPSGQSAGSQFLVTVRAVDQFWNLVSSANDSVALGSSDTFAQLPADTTLMNGQLQVPARLYRTGPQRIWARDLTNGGALPDTSSYVTVTGGPFARVLILAPGESVAPGTATGRTGTALDQSINAGFAVTVLATDAWWNPVGGVSDVVHLTSSDILATMPPDAPMVNGQVDLTVRLAAGGFQQITVSDVTQPSITGSWTQVKAITSGYHLEASTTPTPANVEAGEIFTLTVKVTNDAGAVITEVNSLVTVEARHASTGAPGQGQLLASTLQLIQGQRSISESYTCAEPVILVVRDNAGNAPGVTGVVTVSPGPPASINLSSNPQWVGGNRHAAVSAKVADVYGNGVANQPVSMTLLAGTGLLSGAQPLTDATGYSLADFLSPRQSEKDLIRAASGAFSDTLEIETALVDPGAPGGYVTSYPNPFRPPGEPATVAYKLADDASVTLRIFTLSGDLVREEHFNRGDVGGRVGLNSFSWDGRNGAGALVSSGGYLLLIEAEGSGETLHVMRRKLAVVR